MSYFNHTRLEKCIVCKGDFKRNWHRVDAKTCSNKCRQKAHRDRKAAAAEAVLATARDKAAKTKAARKRRKSRRST